jgi:hypothetical protein
MARSSRSWHSILDLLPPAQRRAYLELKGYPPDYKPPALEWQGDKRARHRRKRTRLEPLWVLARLMAMKPGEIERWPDELVQRTEREEGE